MDLSKRSEWKHWNLFLLKLSLFNLFIDPSALKSSIGLTSVELLLNKLDDKLSSSKNLNSFMLSGSVTKLLPCRSRDFKRLIDIKLRILDGLIEL